MIILAAFVFQPTEPPSQRTSPWETHERTRGCLVETEFTDGTALELRYDSYTQRGAIAFSNARWRSVQDEREYTFSLSLPPLGSLQLKGVGTPAEGSGGFTIPFEGTNFITQLMEADQLHISRGRNVVGRYSLAGSYAAALDLARCNHRVLNRVRPDPFSEGAMAALPIQRLAMQTSRPLNAELTQELRIVVDMLKPQLPLRQKTPDIVERANVGRSTFYEHHAGADAVFLEAVSRPLALLADTGRGEAGHRGPRAPAPAVLGEPPAGARAAGGSHGRTHRAPAG